MAADLENKKSGKRSCSSYRLGVVEIRTRKSRPRWIQVAKVYVFFGEPFGRQIHRMLFNDIEWWKSGILEKCIENERKVAQLAKRFQPGYGCWCGSAKEKVWQYEEKDLLTKWKIGQCRYSCG